MPLNNLYKKIVALSDFDIETETIEIINENSDYIANLLAIQLSQGKDSEGEPITLFGKDYYSDATVFEKQRHGVGLGRVTDRITLYMTGSFYQSLRVITKGTRFAITSDVDYFERILLMSGTNIMKLNIENLRDFSQNILIPQLKIRWRLRNT